MSLLEGYFVGATNLMSLTGFTFRDITPVLLTGGPWRGENEVIPGMPGEVGTTWVRDAYDMPLPFTIGPEDGSGVISSSPTTMRAQMLANLAALEAVFTTSNATHTRRLAKATTPFYVDTTCDGQCRSITLEQVVGDEGNPDAFSVDGVLNLRNLSGGWA